MDGLFGDGLVDVLCCGGDGLEEDLRWGSRLGAIVDLVVFEGGVALFKIVESFSIFWLFLRSVLIHRISPVLVFQASFWYTVASGRFVRPHLLPGIQFVRL